jgi:hypothetical protein
MEHDPARWRSGFGTTAVRPGVYDAFLIPFSQTLAAA